MAETYRQRAEQERAFARTAIDAAQMRISLDLAEQLEALADAFDRLDAARRR
jgi:hypothetical protein